MGTQQSEAISPFKRLLRLLSNERKDIGYIYFYAVVVGFISLVLPLGIQAIFSLVSSGSVFSSVWVLMSLVVIGLIVSSLLQIVQVSLVELLQKRIFAKAAFEFSYRLPRIRAEALIGINPVEMVNRFFDVVTIQKALPKFLIDITSAILQIIFGLILLSFYHPFFIAFSLIIVAIFFVFAKISGKKALETSIIESKYKYKVAAWLEDIGVALFSFKMTPSSSLTIQKMDALLMNYIKYRSEHFKYLKGFYYYAMIFKTLIIGGLLILGTYLLIDRKITLGQFVASEIVIVLLTGAVEKLFLSIDIVFDLLTAVDKLGQVTDLPLEKETGLKELPQQLQTEPLFVIKNLSYSFTNASKKALNDISIDITKGEKICFTGPNGSGKHTFVKILSGILHDYSGIVLYNNFSFRDLNVNQLRKQMAMNFPNQDIFDGTIAENITMGIEAHSNADEIRAVLEKLHLTDEIAILPDGLQTQMIASGKYFAQSFVTKIILARYILAKPQIFLYTDNLQDIEINERLRLINLLTSPDNPWTLIALSKDPAFMAACDRVACMNDGRIEAVGSYKDVLPYLSIA